MKSGNSFLSRQERSKLAGFFGLCLICGFFGVFQVTAQQNDEKVKYVSVVNDDLMIKPEADESSIKKLFGNVKIIEEGILNEKAVYLPDPIYPSAAKTANVKGEVNVEVLIDGKGYVKQVKAVSGNHLLHNAAVWAAYRAKFRPAKIKGEKVFVKGIIVYTF